MHQDLPCKVMEQKSQIENLQKMLMQREAERDLYLASKGGNDG